MINQVLQTALSVGAIVGDSQPNDYQTTSVTVVFGYESRKDPRKFYTHNFSAQTCLCESDTSASVEFEQGMGGQKASYIISYLVVENNSIQSVQVTPPFRVSRTSYVSDIANGLAITFGLLAWAYGGVGMRVSANSIGTVFIES